MSTANPKDDKLPNPILSYLSIYLYNAVILASEWELLAVNGLNDWLSVPEMIGCERFGAPAWQLHHSPGLDSVPKDIVRRTTALWAYSTP